MNLSKVRIPCAALAAVVSCFVASSALATIVASNDFESTRDGFTPSDGATLDDIAFLDSYASGAQPTATPQTSDSYPFTSGFGSKYLTVDTGDDTLWRTFTERTAGTYFDAYMQFMASTENFTYDDGAKLVVYLDAATSKLHVISGTSASDHTIITNALSTTLTPGTWARLTVNATPVADSDVFKFQILLNGNILSTENSVRTFYSMYKEGSTSANIAKLGFKGTGAIDNLAIRSTDPHATAAATVNGERYATLEQALEEANGETITLAADHAEAIAYSAAAGTTYNIAKGSYTFGGFTSAVLAITESTVNGVTTYTLSTPVASVNGALYASLSAAMPNSTSEYPATLLANCSEAITIPQGTTLYLAEGNHTFSGTFSGAGTVNLRAKPKTYSADTNTSLFSNTWTGTCQLNWNPKGGAFAMNEFGNENSIVEIVTDFTAYPATQWSNGTAPAINPTIKLSKRWYIKDGWGGTDTATTIRVLTGSSDLLVDGSSNYSTPEIYYNINVVSNFTGYLVTGGNNGSSYANKDGRGRFRIGNILTDGTYGDRIVKTDVFNGSKFKYRDLEYTTVNGESLKLLVDNETSGNRGIYIASASTTVDGETTHYKTVAEATAAAISAADNATSAPSVTIYNDESLSEGWTASGSGVYVLAPKARIGQTPYYSLSKAIESAGSAAPVTIDLIANNNESVTIPANVTVAVADDIVFSGTLSGSGAIKYTTAPASFDPEYRFNKGADGWRGTFVVDYTVSGAFSAHAYGISGSTVEIAAGHTAIGHLTGNLSAALRISGTLVLNNGYSADKKVMNSVTGSGTLVFASNNATINYAIDNLVDWNGVITNASKYALVTNIVSGSGKVVFSQKPNPTPTVGENWRGTVVIDWAETSALDPNNYGNANSTVALSKDFASGGYFGTSHKEPLTISPTIRLDADVAIKNGYSESSDTALVTFTRMTGEHKLTTSVGTGTDGGGMKTRRYAITTLDNFTGSFKVAAGSELRIGTVNVPYGTVLTGCVIPIDCQPKSVDSGTSVDGTVSGDLALVVADSAAGTLVYATVNNQSGLYLAVAQVGNVKYATLADAAANAGSAKTITKLADTTEAVPAGWKLNKAGTAYIKRGPIICFF